MKVLIRLNESTSASNVIPAKFANKLAEDFSVRFMEDVVKHWDYIMAKPIKYHRTGVGLSIRNLLLRHIKSASKTLAEKIGNPIWRDDNWLEVLKVLKPIIDVKLEQDTSSSIKLPKGFVTLLKKS